MSGHINSLAISLRTVSRVNRTVKISFRYGRALQNIVVVPLLSFVHVNSSIFRTEIVAPILWSMLSYMIVRFHMLLVVRNHIRFLKYHRF